MKGMKMAGMPKMPMKMPKAGKMPMMSMPGKATKARTFRKRSLRRGY